MILRVADNEEETGLLGGGGDRLPPFQSEAIANYRLRAFLSEVGRTWIEWIERPPLRLFAIATGSGRQVYRRRKCIIIM
ncbi:MAG: hypothetical protein AAFY15_03560 [Cyanobacteria bacterium J06648_11]